MYLTPTSSILRLLKQGNETPKFNGATGLRNYYTYCKVLVVENYEGFPDDRNDGEQIYFV